MARRCNDCSSPGTGAFPPITPRNRVGREPWDTTGVWSVHRWVPPQPSGVRHDRARLAGRHHPFAVSVPCASAAGDVECRYSTHRFRDTPPAPWPADPCRPPRRGCEWLACCPRSSGRDRVSISVDAPCNATLHFAKPLGRSRGAKAAGQVPVPPFPAEGAPGAFGRRLPGRRPIEPCPGERDFAVPAFA